MIRGKCKKERWKEEKKVRGGKCEIYEEGKKYTLIGKPKSARDKRRRGG